MRVRDQVPVARRGKAYAERGVNSPACEKNRFRFGKIIALTPAQRSTHPEKRFQSLGGLKVIRFEVSNLRIFKWRVSGGFG